MFNANKAGLEKVDKAEVNRIIEEASKGTPFWEHQKRRDERHAERIQKALQKLAAASPKELADAKQWAASTLQRLDTILQDCGDEENLRHVVHVDLDAFYASVEERDDPRLREVAMAVGGSSMLSTSNYAARKFGVRAGLPGFIAKKLCPQLVIVPLNPEKYEHASSDVMSILSKFDPSPMVFGLDEAALDITDYCRSTSEGGISPDEAVHQLRTAVREGTGLTCSAGIAPNGLLAKICADINKPDGQFCLDTPESIKNFLAPLGVRKIPGIGQVQEKVLSALGIETCGDLLENGDRLLLSFGERSAESYLRAAKGIGSTFGQDDKTASAGFSRKSKSAEATFHDSADPEFLADVVKQLCVRLAEELVAANLRGRLVTVKLKMASFDVFSRSVALEIATNDESALINHAQRILRYALDRKQGQALRLLGVKMSNFVAERSDLHSTGRQTTLSQVLAKSRTDGPSPKTVNVEENSVIAAHSNGDAMDDENSHSPVNVTSDIDEDESHSLHKACSEALQHSIVEEQTPESKGKVLCEESKSSDARSSTNQTSPTKSERAPQSGQQSASTEALIEETYCPICAVIMRGVSERHVNRHIDACLRHEQKREHASPGNIHQGRTGAGSIRKTLAEAHSQKSTVKGPTKRKGAAGGIKDHDRRVKQPTHGSITTFFSR